MMTKFLNKLTYILTFLFLILNTILLLYGISYIMESFIYDEKFVGTLEKIEIINIGNVYNIREILLKEQVDEIISKKVLYSIREISFLSDGVCIDMTNKENHLYLGITLVTLGLIIPLSCILLQMREKCYQLRMRLRVDDIKEWYSNDV